jgi:hypothetical protein
MDEMQRQMAGFVSYVRNEVMARAQQADPSRGALVPVRRSLVIKPEKKRQ